MWSFSTKRSVRDSRTLTLQENRARAVVTGQKPARTPRFVTTRHGAAEVDEKALARARRLVGLKGYVTHIPATLMPPGEVIASYHDLWHVEQSFRMSKTDLRARPMSCAHPRRDRGPPGHRSPPPPRRQPRSPEPHRIVDAQVVATRLARCAAISG